MKHKFPHYLLFIIILFGGLNVNAQNSFDNYVHSIKEEVLKEHVYFLASDTMFGRTTGKHGQKMAADYISSYWRKHGVDSMGLQGYYQPFNLYKVNRGRGSVSSRNLYYKHFDVDYMPLFSKNFSSQAFELNDTLSFVWAGLAQNYKGKNFSDKVVVCLLDKNLEKSYRNIKNIAKETGAKVFVLYFPKSGMYNFNPEKHRLSEVEKSGKLGAVTYKLRTWVCEHDLAKLKQYEELLSKFAACEDTLFVAGCSPWGTKRLFDKKYKELYRHARKSKDGLIGETPKFINDTAVCEIKTKDYELDTLFTENVVSFVEGTTNKDEVIVVSAHYDHVRSFKNNIKYGADDNASGTVAVMEMARVFNEAAKQGVRPKRSVLFVTFSGEEIGLKGSDYFVENCPVPINKVVLNFNLDMIGRNKKDKEKFDKTVYLISKGQHKGKVKRSVRRKNRKNDSLKVSFHPGVKERFTWAFSSDHFRFKRYNIPIACFFTGLHPDYHTKRDTPDKINYPKMTEITKLSAKTIWDLANQEKSLKVDVKKPEKENFIEKMMD